MSVIDRIFVCPTCHTQLVSSREYISCNNCGSKYMKNTYGYMEFIAHNDANYNIDTTTDQFSKIEEVSGPLIYNNFLKPIFCKNSYKNILEVGCGVGIMVNLLINEGYSAYGIDLPGISKYWEKYNNSPNAFLCCDANKLPFPDSYFDIVFSMGVIEHIGTKIGHCTLSENYWEIRQQFAKELLRVTRPGGRIIITCPNKSFPIDLAHGPNDGLGNQNFANKIRMYICSKTMMNIHPTWGSYHLLSYKEINKLFFGVNNIRALDQKGHFAFYGFDTGFKKIFAKCANYYVSNLPTFLRPTFVNPYVAVEITK